MVFEISGTTAAASAPRTNHGLYYLPVRGPLRKELQIVYRLGVVSFLNARPLIDGLAQKPDVTLTFDVPARLPNLLDTGAVDAALIPIVDVLRSNGRYVPVSDGCIASDGETMTVRVFSQLPPDRIRTLHADGDSHTSVALARVLWQQVYDQTLELVPLDARNANLADCPSVLLIGDKVIDPARSSFAYEVDLGGAWRAHTGHPFVFAVWARRADDNRDPAAIEALAHTLNAARDRGVARAAAIADEFGPAAGWPIELARRYLTRCLRFQMDARAIAGVAEFVRCASAADLLPAAAAAEWRAAARRIHNEVLT
jgi:chorismate dehydratase